LVYPFFVSMKLVVASFVLYPQQNKYSGSHTYGQSCYIDKGEAFISNQVPVSDLEIIFDHDLSR
jgi:hypothetical protein